MTVAENLAEPVGLRWPESKWPLPVALVALVTAADYLLYGQPAGLGWAALFLLLALTLIVSHSVRVCLKALVIRAALAAGSILPLLENVSLLSFCVAATGMATLALLCSGKLREGAGHIASQLVGFFLILPFRLIGDGLKARAQHKSTGRRWVVLAQALVWIVPVFFGGLFLLLFGVANPVIEEWLSRIDLFALLGDIDPVRVVFWLLAACGLWAYLRPRFAKLPRLNMASRPARVEENSVANIVFGPAALLRALLVFNGLFALQNGLDGLYLWGGAALPDGMSYASYAHRGAYALIVTALLAAGFVLAAMRPGSETSGNALIRKLVYLWTAQNIWLVISSILRLDLYVDTYALTYWRVAAFLWMVLVALGLGFIVARIALGKSNRWLVSANLLTLSTLLYVCCFINFAGLIASYNVEHSRDVRGSGMSADVSYLGDLGPEAIPALDRLIVAQGERECTPDRTTECPTRERQWLAYQTEKWTSNWRYGTFRNLRLMGYLEKNPMPSFPASEATP